MNAERYDAPLPQLTEGSRTRRDHHCYPSWMISFMKRVPWPHAKRGARGGGHAGPMLTRSLRARESMPPSTAPAPSSIQTLTDEVETLAAQVEEHLTKTGASWK
jgi:hypothetical protein